MPAPSLSELITIRDVMKSTVDGQTNSLSYNLGNIKRNETVTVGAQIWQQPGLYSIPPDSNSTTQGPQVICLTRSDIDLVIAQRDTRYQPSGINSGETYLYAGGSDAFLHLKNDKSITMSAQTSAINILGNNIVIGDNSARFVAHSDEVLTILQAMLVEIAADISLLTNPPTSTTFTAYAPAKLALLTTLQTAISAQLSTLPTTKVKLT